MTNDNTVLKSVVLPFKTDNTGSEIPWLSALKNGTMFLFRPRDYKGFGLQQAKKMMMVGKACAIEIIGPTDSTIDWVDPVIFSNQMELFEETHIEGLTLEE